VSVVITGSTGFLGLRLIRELLGQYDRLTLLSRPGSPPVTDRVLRFLRWSGLPEHELARAPERLKVLDADLSLPLLGMTRPVYDRLADEVNVLWHCAADISFTSNDQRVRTVNVDGTRRVLDLLSVSEQRPLLCYASSVAVAGRQRSGVVREVRLDDCHGFHNPYEQSKFDAERAVFDWTDSRRHTALVFRISGLITRRTSYPWCPPHPLLLAARALNSVLRTAPGIFTPDGSIGVPGMAEEAKINFVPVEHAAHAMAEAARLTPDDGRSRIYHVVHSRNVALTTVLEVLGTHVGARFRVGPSPSKMSGRHDMELSAWEQIAMYLPWLGLTRIYDDSGLTALGLACPKHLVVDHDYLTASLTSPSTS
jgi:thioester reductase-like protein